MALAADVVWEVQTTGDDNNGGGFNSSSSGTDYSQQASAQLTVTDAATSGVGSTTLTSATGGFTSQMVGNVLHLYSGTNLTAGWYEITAYTDTNTVTIDRAPDDGVGGVSGATCKVGGSFATPGGLGAALANASAAGQVAWVKGGTYVLTSSSANVSGGLLQFPANKMFTLEGYATTRGDSGQATIDAGVLTSVDMILLRGTYANKRHLMRNIVCDGKSNTGVKGFHESGGGYKQTFTENCEAKNCKNYGFYGINLVTLSCKAYNCSPHGFYVAAAFDSWADSCDSGFIHSNTANRVFENCVASNSTNDGFDSSGSSYPSLCVRCTAHNNGASGFVAVSFDMNAQWYECVSTDNGQYGFETNASYDANVFIRCSGRNNTSGNYKGTANPIDWLTITADPFVNAAAGDFRLNNTAGSGAVLRGAGLGVYGQTDNQDVGAVQHSDPTGGGGDIWPYIRPRRIGS